MILLYTLLLANSCLSVEHYVYVCDSQNATRYHYKANCRGLSNCKHVIIHISFKDAKKRGKTLCKWED